MLAARESTEPCSRRPSGWLPDGPLERRLASGLGVTACPVPDRRRRSSRRLVDRAVCVAAGVGSESPSRSTTEIWRRARAGRLVGGSVSAVERPRSDCLPTGCGTGGRRADAGRRRRWPVALLATRRSGRSPRCRRCGRRSTRSRLPSIRRSQLRRGRPNPVTRDGDARPGTASRAPPQQVKCFLRCDGEQVLGGVAVVGGRRGRETSSCRSRRRICFPACTIGSCDDCRHRWSAVGPADEDPDGWTYVQNRTFFWVDQGAGPVGDRVRRRQAPAASA